MSKKQGCAVEEVVCARMDAVVVYALQTAD